MADNKTTPRGPGLFLWCLLLTLLGLLAVAFLVPESHVYGTLVEKTAAVEQNIGAAAVRTADTLYVKVLGLQDFQKDVIHDLHEELKHSNGMAGLIHWEEQRSYVLFQLAYIALLNFSVLVHCALLWLPAAAVSVYCGIKERRIRAETYSHLAPFWGTMRVLLIEFLLAAVVALCLAPLNCPWWCLPALATLTACLSGFSLAAIQKNC